MDNNFTGIIIRILKCTRSAQRILYRDIRRMGITAGPYTTEEGFTIPCVYLSIDCFRLLKALGSTNFGTLFVVNAYRSRDDKLAGRQALRMPAHLTHIEMFLAPDDFYKQTLYGYAYTAIKAVWTTAGYTVTDIHETGQPYPNTFIYDASGFNFAGFNHLGWDADGYGEDGFNATGWDREQYDREGFNAAGYNRGGFNKDGFNKDGYDMMGFNAAGWDKDGYDRLGYNAAGYNREGYDKNGFDKDGYDAQGYNAAGVNAAGESRPQLHTPV
jgi:hypothetical protein